MLAKNAPKKYSMKEINVQSPFKKVTNIENNIPKINYLNNSTQILNPCVSGVFQEKYFNTPVHFGLNFYFSQPKSNYYQPQVYSPNIKSQEIIYPSIYNPENIPNHIMFKNSLAKSGYRLNQNQFVQFKDDFIRPNNINNNMKNNYNLNYCSINNNNIINNIYPTFTRVTTVQILPDNESTKVNENKKEEKKYNLNIKNDINKEENLNNNANDNNNSNKKVIFECSETNENNMNNKILLKKKRYRKNREQLGLLSKYYKENKNWSKNKIKEISEIVGLKENKIYKWLWDQKNKEFKGTKFVVNK